MVIFGGTLEPAPSTESAAWLTDSCTIQPWTVDGIMPSRYESVLRLHPPDSEPEHLSWWERYCDLFSSVASIGAEHTSAPDLGRFAVWEGHGFAESTSGIGWRQPAVDEAEQRRRDALREEHRIHAEERNAGSHCGWPAGSSSR